MGRLAETGKTALPVLLTQRHNWLDPRQAVAEWVPWQPDMGIADMLDTRWPDGAMLEDGLDVAVFYNGEQLDIPAADAVRLAPGDVVELRVVPADGGDGGSNPLSAIAMLAVMVASIYVPGAMGLVTAKGSLTLAGAMVAGGISLVGGMIVNAVLPPPKPSLGNGIGQNPLDTSVTYGWQAQRNPMEPGRPVAVLQGEKSNFIPTKLTQHITTSGDKQYLNMLFAVCDGPAEVFDVRINDTPIASMTGVEMETTPGTADQAVVPWFNDAISETNVSVKVGDDWHPVTLAGTGVQAVEFGLLCPGGLGYANDSGGLDNVTVTVELAYRPRGAADWTSLGRRSISGAKRAAIMRAWRYEVAGSGPFDVAVRVVSAPGGDRYISDVYFEYVQEIVPEDFRLPHVTLVAVRALATDKLNNGAPLVKISARRMQAVLPASDGSTQVRDLTNPVWQMLELLTHPRFGAGEPRENIDLFSFERAAAWCDTCGLSGAMYWDTQTTLATAAGYLGQYGRFTLDRVGTRIVCISDQPEDMPEAAFLASSADILKGTFGVEWPRLAEKTDGLEITYFHPERGRQVVFVPGDFFHTVTDRPPNVGQITLYPCTSEADAVRAGRYLNACNRYLTRIVSLTLRWKAVGSHLRRGAVIQIAEDEFLATQSGLVRQADALTLRVNRPVRLDAGTAYDVVVSHTDRQDPDTGNELVEVRPLVPVAQDTVTDTLTLAAPLEYVPQAGAGATVGQAGRAVRWYRILSLTRAGDMRVTLTALEYDPAVYAAVPAVPQPVPPPAQPGVVGLLATIIDVVEDLVAKKTVSLTWRGTAMAWSVFVRRLGSDADEWRFLGRSPYPAFVARNIEVGHMYRFAVTHTASVADGMTVDVDFQLNTPSGSVRPVMMLQGGGAVPVTAMINGEETQVMGVF